MDVSVHVLRQIDVADSIDLTRLSEALRELEPTRGAAVVRGPERPTGAGVVLRNEPLDLQMRQRTVGGFASSVRLRVFDFGVVGVRFTLVARTPAVADLIGLAASIAAESGAFDREARNLWKDISVHARDAVSPWEEAPAVPLIEDYTVFVLPKAPDAEDADDALAHVLFNEPARRRLSRSLVKEVGRRAIRYYEEDLVIVDYDTAILVDETGGAPLVDIFEIASAQLLEFRYYDALLSRALGALAADVRQARTAASLIIRSPYSRVSRRAASLALEVSELNDRLERAITLVGDTYTVQVYREASLRFRLAEAGNAVREKIGMIGRAADVVGREVQTRRDTALELLVVFLILLEIIIAIKWPSH
ncbi:MAG: hypothetical protein ABTD50_10265 [Polyangiaceae bacterium]|jgi:hypothetical protein